jgi:hypothetical protein
VSNTTTTNGQNDINGTSSNYYVGQAYFNSGENCNVGKVTAYLNATGTVTVYTYICEIWSVSGDNLNALQGSSTAVTGVNSWADTAVDFIFSSPVAVLTANDYHLVIRSTAGSPDSSNTVSWNYTADGVIAGTFGRWIAAGTINATNTRDMRMVVYKI